MPDLNTGIHDAENRLLDELRRQRRRLRETGEGGSDVSVGQKVADAVAATIGSWPFIIIQSCLLAAWVTLNVIAWMRHWDPYPFILLNLALSFQAAYAGPFRLTDVVLNAPYGSLSAAACLGILAVLALGLFLAIRPLLDRKLS